MTMTIDDATILKRAKQLCRDDGVAWDWFSATSTGARVLNDKERKESEVSSDQSATFWPRRRVA
jgi:hypothetical protein